MLHNCDELKKRSIKNVITSYSPLVFIFAVLVLVTTAKIVGRDQHVKKAESLTLLSHIMFWRMAETKVIKTKCIPLMVMAQAMFQVTVIKQLVNKPVWLHYKDKAQREVLVYALLDDANDTTFI